MPDDGKGCIHCTEVPCQLLVASRLDTTAWGCSMSMLSTDTTVSIPGIKEFLRLRYCILRGWIKGAVPCCMSHKALFFVLRLWQLCYMNCAV